MKIISHLVAVSNELVIGVDNNLPWNLKDDLAHFKKYTLKIPNHVQTFRTHNFLDIYPFVMKVV